MCSRYTYTKDEAKLKLRDQILVFGCVPRGDTATSSPPTWDHRMPFKQLRGAMNHWSFKTIQVLALREQHETPRRRLESGGRKSGSFQNL